MSSADISASRTQESLVVGVIALAAGLVAATADAAPTGLGWWDAALVFGLAVIAVAVGSKAPRWVAIAIASIAAAAAATSTWAILAWVALAVALAAAFLLRRSRIASALAAALSVQVLLRLPSFGFFGLQSIIAGFAFSLALFAGYRFATRSARKKIRRVTLVLLGLTVVGGLVGGLSLLGARTDVERGVDAARRGLAAARAGEASQVGAELRIAEDALSAADATASGFLASPLRLIPVAAQHHRAVVVATSEGAQIAREAAAAVREADIESITLRAGSVDLAALQAMAPRLRSTATALSDGAQSIQQASSPWLLPGVRSRLDELMVEVEELLPEAELAAEAADVVPNMLGASGRRTYFVIFGTPAEAREFSGLLGSWALLHLDGGRITFGDSGRINRLYRVAAENSVPEGLVNDWYMQMARPSQFPQNLTSSPDFETVAEVSKAIFAGAFTDEIDGFIHLDAWTIADLLQLTGPVEIPFQSAPLTAANAPDFFFEGQYRIADVNRSELFDTLSGVAGAVVQAITTEQDLPGPEELGRLLGPAARAGRLQVVTFDERENNFLKSVKLLREFGSTEAQDFIGLIQTNGTPSKLDIYLDRRVEYDVAVGLDGALTGTVRVMLTSKVPDNAPAYTLGPERYDSVNRVLMSLYSPSVITGSRLDGDVVARQVNQEFTFGRYLIDAPVLPDAVPVVVEYDIAGQIETDRPYSLEIWHQPLVNNDEVRVSYVGPEGSFVWEAELVENVVLDAAELAS